MATKRYVSIQYEHEELGENHALGCQCCRFRAGYDLPIPATLTIAETKATARRLSLSIFRDWTQLNAIVKRFESTIQKRWMKKNIKQRREILSKAWPSISSTHRPDFEHFRSNKKQLSRSKTTRTEAFLWPHINLEDLQQRHLLLLFINSRGRNLPDVHRAADFGAAHLGEGFENELSLGVGDHDYCCASHFLEENPVDELCINFSKTTSPALYGTVVEPAKLRLTKGFKHVRAATEGLVSLEIQQGVYRFLLACAKLILHDIEPVMFLLAPHQSEPEMPVPRTTDWQNVTTHALEAAYKTPQKLDLERLRMLVGGRRAAAEDHVYSLKEDPSYFIETVREWREHSDIGTLPGVCHCIGCAQGVAPCAIEDAYIAFIVWDDIYRKLETMPSMDVQMARANEKWVRLADEDAIRWSALSYMVKSMATAVIRTLRDGVPYSPRLRNVSEVLVKKDGEDDWVLRTRKASDAQCRVHNLFYAVFDEYLSGLHHLPNLVGEIQYMLDTDDEASLYVDSWMTEHFSDLALLCELGKATLSLQPWFDSRVAFDWDYRLKSQGQRLNKVDTTLSKLVRGISTASPKTTKFCDPLDHAFDYPAEKARTKANVDQMRKAERHLDEFWLRLEGEVKRTQKLDMKALMRRRAFETRTIYRTPPWQEPETTAPRTPTKVLRDIDPNVYRTFDSPTGPKFTPTSAKEKVKTRGAIAGAHHPRATAEAPPAVQPEEATPPKIKIHRKAYAVFTSLLPTTTSAGQPCPEVAWDDFLFAMNAIGMEPEKLYGSVWIFKPVSGERMLVDVTRSISFHEPKEVRKGRKITRPMVRTFGRRLKHAYGWGEAENMFEVE